MGICAQAQIFRHYLTKQPKEDMGAQLHELVTNDMLKTMFPSLNTLANVCLSIPVGTASVERSFSQMKMIKTRYLVKLRYSILHVYRDTISEIDAYQNTCT